MGDLLKMVKMFFTKPSNIKEVDTVKMKHIPPKGFKYLMWCGHCLYTKDKCSTLNPVDKNHEMIHLRQAQDKGSWAIYYLSYLWEWIKGWPYKDSYYTIKYEVESYAKEYDLDYLNRRKKGDVILFKLYNRHGFYKSCKSRISYKQKLRELYK